MKFTYVLLLLSSCFQEQPHSSQEKQRALSNDDAIVKPIHQENEEDSSDKTSQKTPQIKEEEEEDPGINQPEADPQIFSLRSGKIVHRAIPETPLHTIVVETNNEVEFIEVEVCHQALDCFSFQQTRVYDLLEDKLPGEVPTSGPMTITASACNSVVCSEPISINSRYKNTIDPITASLLESREEILSNLKTDLAQIRSSFQEYLTQVSTCRRLTESEQEVINALTPMIESQLKIHDQHYLDALAGNFPDKNRIIDANNIRERVEGILDQNTLIEQAISESKENQSTGLTCTEGQAPTEEGDEQSEQSAPNLLKTFGNLLLQQYNPVEGFKRNFINSVKDLKDPLRGCTLACPALVGL